MVNKKIIVKTRFTGFHRWPAAPKTVAFLRNKHRHVFYVEVSFQLKEDRSLEYFLVLSIINERIAFLYSSEHYDLGSKSCESIAEELLFDLLTDDRTREVVSVMILEDNENGSVASFEG